MSAVDKMLWCRGERVGTHDTAMLYLGSKLSSFQKRVDFEKEERSMHAETVGRADN